MDTLSDHPDINDIFTLDRAILPDDVGIVGFVITGSATFVDPRLDFGRALVLPTGERLQVRASPRGALGKLMEPGEVRVVVAVRRMPNKQPQSSVAVLVRVSDFDGTELDHTRDSTSAMCAGAGGLHMLSAARFSKHTNDISLDVTNEGFHYIGPVLLSVDRPGETSRFTPALAYARLAAVLAGQEVPVKNYPLLCSLPNNDYVTLVSSLISGLRSSAPRGGPGASFVSYTNVAVRMLESMDAEGLLCLLTDARTSGGLPDMLVLPAGMKLTIVMACRIATFAREYAHVAPTPRDARLNIELSVAFAARFPPIILNDGENTESTYAIDLVLSHATDHLADYMQTCQSSRAPALVYFASLGQRLISETCGKLQHQDNVDYEAVEILHAAPRAELLKDPLADAKYAALRPDGAHTHMRSSRQTRFLGTPQAALRDQLVEIHYEVEQYLRTGTFFHGGRDLILAHDTSDGERPPCAKCAPRPCDCIHPDSESKPTNSPSLNSAAMQAAISAVYSTLRNDGHASDLYGLGCFIVTEHEHKPCVDCGTTTGVLPSTLTPMQNTWCPECCATRCRSCAAAANANGLQVLCSACKTKE